MRLPARNRVRIAVLAGTVLSHALLIWVMATRTTDLEPESADEFSSSPIYLQPLIVEPVAPRRSQAMTLVRKSQPRHAESAAITAEQPEQAPAPSDTPEPQVDWANEATTIARKLADPESGPVQFGNRHKEAPPTDDRYIHPLIKPPVRRAGLIEMVGPGIERRWLSERCYIEFGRLPELFPAPGPRVNPVRCMIGPSIDGHIFDHLKPKYLQQE